MDILDPALNEYSENHTADEPPVLAQLNRETYASVLMPRMLSGHLQGRVLSMISHMVRPESILEIGTYTGYSAICLAEGLSENGLLHTIDINDELEEMVNSYFEKSGFRKKIKNYYGDAIKLIPGIPGPFDIVFIDADKINYSNYFQLVFDNVRPGGYIIADNVLWNGKILDDASRADKDTRALQQFNDMIQDDGRIENLLLPVRDGLMIMRKKI
jgi:caffeoyl-CoA O-methyltransferase